MIQSRTLKGQQCQTPPSSSGPGRGPLKAQTGVRVPLGAQLLRNRQQKMLSGFLSMLGFDSRGKVKALGLVRLRSSVQRGKVSDVHVQFPQPSIFLKTSPLVAFMPLQAD